MSLQFNTRVSNDRENKGRDRVNEKKLIQGKHIELFQLTQGHSDIHISSVYR